MKKILINLIFILIISCGFVPMLKDFDGSKINIKKVFYEGQNELTYLLKSNLNFIENPSKNGMTINLTITELVSSAIKNSSGIATQQDVTISVNLNVFDNKSISLLRDNISETKRLPITNNLGNDEQNKTNERNKIVQVLAQKIKFKLMSLNQKNHDN